jgi:hypothetical protein
MGRGMRTDAVVPRGEDRAAPKRDGFHPLTSTHPPPRGGNPAGVAARVCRDVARRLPCTKLRAGRPGGGFRIRVDPGERDLEPSSP